MAREIQQSAIREVRDQLMLDTADGSYLNIVTSNVGLDRPKYGLTDDEWRAIAKVLGLHYKQIRTKFEEVLSIVYGPKTTLIGSLKVAVSAGESKLYVHSTELLPQVGTVVIDKGLPNEETIPYSFIDRTNNAIYLDSLVTYGHVSTLNDVESPLLVDRPVGSTLLIVPSVDKYPSSFPFSLIVGRGTPTEETVTVTAKDLVARTLTVSPLTFAQSGSTPGSVYTKVHSDYVTNTYFISATDISMFPDEGEILLAEPPIFTTVTGTTGDVVVGGGSFIPDQLIGRKVIFHGNVTPGLSNVVATVAANTDSSITFSAAIGTAPAAGDTFYSIDAFSATSGTTSSVTATGSFANKELTGYKIVFVGNTTSALREVSRDIESNTADTITFSTDTGVAPAATDIFFILPRVGYVRASYDENVLVLRKELYADIPRGMKVELLRRNSLAGLSQAQVGGVGWSVFQVDPQNIEILLPSNIQEPKTIRNTSYVHDKLIAVSATTLSSLASEADTSLTLTSLSGWPMNGVVVIGGSARYGFGRRIIEDRYVAAGSTNTTINLQTGGLTVNALIGQDVILGPWSGTVVSNTASSITFEQIIPSNVIADLTSLSTVKYVHPFVIDLLHEAVPVGGFIIGTTASLYQPVYAATDLISGNFRSIPDSYPGPYIYSQSSDAPTNLQSSLSLSQRLAGPTKLVVSQNSLSNALEVEDASFFPLTGFPYSATLGGPTGNNETVEVTGVLLKQQVGVDTTIPLVPVFVTVNAAASIDDTSLTLTTTAGTTQNSAFPQANGYRVLVGRGTANEEVVWVTGVTGATTISCESLTKPHAVGESIELLSDVVTVSNLTKSHSGYISEAYKKVRWPSITSTDRTNSEVLQVHYTSVLLNGTTGLATSGDSVVLNFGKNSTDVETSISNNPSVPSLSYKFNVLNASLLPVPQAGGYPIIIGAGTVNEEVAFVTSVDTGINEVTISKPTQKQHLLGDKIKFTSGSQETVEYSTTIGNTLSFPSYIMLQSNHHTVEPVMGSEIKSIPKLDGFDFPFRMPPNLFDQLYALFDMVRAAGVQVTIIEQR